MKIITAKDLKKVFRIALVVSRFNEEITQRLCEGAIQRLKELEVHAEDITIVWVPGAVEIPLAAKFLAMTDRYDAIIALGAVIRGETVSVALGCSPYPSERTRTRLAGALA